MKKAIPYVLVGLAGLGIGYYVGCMKTKKDVASKPASAPAPAASTATPTA